MPQTKKRKMFFLDFLNSILQVAIFGSSNRPNFGAEKKATWRKISQPEKTDAWDVQLLVEEYLSEQNHLISKITFKILNRAMANIFSH